MSHDGLNLWMDVAKGCLEVLDVPVSGVDKNSKTDEMLKLLPFFLETMCIDATTYTSASLQFLNSLSFLLPGAPVRICGSNMGMAVLPFLFPRNEHRNIFAIEISSTKSTKCRMAFKNISDRFSAQVFFQANDALIGLESKCGTTQIILVDVEIENSKDSYVTYFEKLSTLPGKFLIIFHDAFVPKFSHVFAELELAFDRTPHGKLLMIKTDDNGFAMGFIQND